MTGTKLKARDADSPARANHEANRGSTPAVAAPPDTAEYTPRGYPTPEVPDDWAVFPITFEQQPDGKWKKLPLVKWREGSKPFRAWTEGELARLAARIHGWGVDCAESGLVVLDEDTTGAVPASVGYEPETCLFGTGSGGRHFVYKAPAEVLLKNATKVFGTTHVVDVRAGGGYIVAPGSRRPDGKTYTVLADVPPAPMPAALVAALPRKAEPKAGGTRKLVRDRAAYCRAALERTLDLLDFLPPGEEGGRNDALNEAAIKLGHLVGFPDEGYLDEGVVRERLIKWALGAGLDGGETVDTIGSGLRAGMAEPYELVEGDGEDEPVASDEGSGWARFDLNEILAEVEAGNLELPKPEVCMTDSGVPLFYNGKVNGIAGDSNAGKTWVTLAAGLQEMRKGRRFVLLDFEDSPKTAVLRLRALGAPLDLIRNLFDYRRPVRHAYADIKAMVTEVAGAYVVLDSTGESMSLAGLSSNDDGETGKWFGAIARPLARGGCCVVLLDHMVKSNDGGLWPIGSQRKRAGLDGAQYVAEVVESFSKEKSGCVAIKVAKDRGGHRAQGDIATFVRFDPGFDGGLFVSFGPGATAEDAAERRAEKAAEKLARDVEELNLLEPPPRSVRDVKERLHWGDARATEAMRTYRESRK